MKLLALDCSTKATGLAIFSDKELLGQSCITATSTDLFKRIHKMVDNIDEICANLAIDTIVMEEVIPDHAKNVQTFKALMYLQGAIMIMLHDKHPRIKIELMYPGSWRKICGIKTGRGNKREALKEQDIVFANSTYNLSLTSDDIADAVCIGHAYLHPSSVENDDLNWG